LCKEIRQNHGNAQVIPIHMSGEKRALTLVRSIIFICNDCRQSKHHHGDRLAELECSIHEDLIRTATAATRNVEQSRIQRYHQSFQNLTGAA